MKELQDEPTQNVEAQQDAGILPDSASSSQSASPIGEGSAAKGPKKSRTKGAAKAQTADRTAAKPKKSTKAATKEPAAKKAKAPAKSKGKALENEPAATPVGQTEAQLTPGAAAAAKQQGKAEPSQSQIPQTSAGKSATADMEGIATEAKSNAKTERHINLDVLGPDQDAKLLDVKAEQEPDEEDEKNVVEPVAEAIRADRLGSRKEPKVFDDLEPGLDESGLSQIQLRTHQEQLIEQVRSQFRVSGSKYHFQDQPAKVAFKDKGSCMVSSSNDDRVSKAMAIMAEGKGWQAIKVSGHPDFKRDVWLEASLRGIEVQGFKPSEQDLKRLENKRERTMHNIVEQVEPRLERRAPVQVLGDAQQLPKNVEAEATAGAKTPEPPLTHNQQVLANMRATAQAKAEPVLTQNQQVLANRQMAFAAKSSAPVSEASLTNNQKILEQMRGMSQLNGNSGLAYVGRVLEHGPARYNNDPKEKLNYFVKLETVAGEKTVWGVDLKRAIGAGNIKVGDQVRLEEKGKQPVTVDALIRDKDGNVIGTEQKETVRKIWDAQKSDKAQVIGAVASAFIDSNVKNPAHQQALKAAVGERVAAREQANKVPIVPVYDQSSPAKTSQERTGPVVERNAERTR